MAAKRVLLTLLALIGSGGFLAAQNTGGGGGGGGTANTIKSGTSLPATCTPSANNIFLKTSAPAALYACTATDTWTASTGSTITTGNLTEATSSVLTITGGTSAVVGTGTTIQVKQATDAQPGYLSAADHAAFNGKQAAGNYLTGLTGDVSASGPGSVAATLASVGSAGTCGDATHSCALTFDAKGRETARANTSITFPTAFNQTVENSGTPLTQRQKLNFVGGTNVTITPTDNGTDTTTLTFDATAGGAGVSSFNTRTGAVVPQSGDYSAFYQATGNYITGLTGDATASGPGSVALTLAAVGSAGTCGDATHTCALTFDTKGRETARVNTSITFPTPFYQTFQHDSTAVTQRAKFNLAAGSNVSITASDNGTDTTTFTLASTAGGGNMNITSGAGAPTGNCTAGTSWYLDTTNQDDWYCSATNTWKKNLSTTDSGPYVATGATSSSAPTAPSAGNASLFFTTNSVAQTENSSGAIAGTQVVPEASATSNQWVTYYDNNGTAHRSQPAASNLSNGTTGTGSVVLATSPTLVTPTLGVATATSINGTTIPSSVTLTRTVASGTTAMPTTALAGNTCDASATTATATGAATTDTLTPTYASDPTGVTGYGAGTNGGITFRYWVTTNTVNFKRCNETASSITPGALSLNWRITR